MKKHITLLLIDDDADDRELFEIALEDSVNNIKFIGVANCAEALHFLTNGGLAPDYIFLDLNMPEMNGRECLYELKRSIHLSRIPVVIFTTSSDPADKKDTLAMGAVEFITKPDKVSDLTQIIDQFLARINQPQKIKSSYEK